MTSREIFEIWSPDAAVWSRWTKPVLFAHLKPRPRTASLGDPAPNVDWAPAAEDQTAIVLDLPGESAAWIGIALAQRGYRPVPLYNAAPGPSGASLIEIWPIVQALEAGAQTLRACHLSADAPPVFLLDANRRGVGAVGRLARFDNRSISFPTDFPSAAFLLDHGIARVLLVCQRDLQPQADLAHTLRNWQESGIAIESRPLELDGLAEPIEVPRPRFHGWIWHRLLASIGLRRNPLGGYGGMLSEPAGG